MSNIREQLFDAIYAQESGRGKAKTDHINAHGVTGPMQVQDKTFRGLQAQGLIPAHYEHTNPQHNIAAGKALINHLADKYKDDPRKVAAAYYGGEKAVRPDGSLANFGDKLNPKAPTVVQYVDQVMGRMGQPVERREVAPAPAPAAPPRDDTPLLERRAPARTEPATALPPVPQRTLGPGPGIVAPAPGSTLAIAKEQGAVAQKAAQQVQDSTHLGRSQAAFLDQPLGAILRTITDRVAQEELPADPGYKLDPRVLEGRTEDEISELTDARSRRHEERLLWEQDERRGRLQEVGRAGFGKAILASLFAGAPEGVLTGLGAFRAAQIAGLQSARFAAQGRTGAAVAASFGENAVANVALTAVQQAIDGYVGPEDYLMGLGFAGIGSALTIPSIHSAALKAQSEALARRAAADIEAKATEIAARLGPDATAEDIVREMKAADAGKAATFETTAGATQLPAGRRLLDVDDDGNLRVESAAPVSEQGRQGYRPLSAEARPKQEYAVLGAPQFDPVGSELALREAVNHFRSIAGGKQTELVSADELTTLFKSDSGLLMKGLTKAEEAAALWMHQKFMPDSRVAVVAGDFPTGSNGDATLANRGGLLRLNTKQIATPAERMTTLVHEMGHAIWKHNYLKVGENVRAGARNEYNEWLKKYHGKEDAPGVDVALQRTSLGSMDIAGVGGPRAVRAQAMAADGALDAGSLFEYMAQVIAPPGARPFPGEAQSTWAKYYGNFEEFTAEQFVKYIESSIDSGRHVPPAGLKQVVVDLFKRLFDLFKRVKEDGLLAPTEGFREFYDAVFKMHKANATRTARAAAGLDPYRNTPGELAVDRSLAANDPIAEQFGLNLLPESTPALVAEKKAIIALYRKAADPAAAWNNIDPKFVDSLTDNSVFNVASSSLRMLKSENPVVRMIAAELLESPSGAAGRNTTAAIKKHVEERRFMGNVINDFQDAYSLWRNESGGNVWKDYSDGEHWARFNREVALYIETQDASNAHPAVLKAAQPLQAAYERMRTGQIDHKTLGWASLPATSVGYMPHKMSPARVRQLTSDQMGQLHSLLVDQFVQIEGWDISFSANLASKYLERVRGRAVGEYESTVGIHQTGAAEIVEDALTAMGMTKDEVREQMAKYMRGAAGHTKRRIKLDLSADLGNGMQLVDLFETDQLKLVRAQAQRVSGEVALARHGVMGKSGLNLLRRAMGHGSEGTRAQPAELEAFDQVAAEFLGEPFGEYQGKWLDRAVQFNSLARLGGMGFTQFAEFINGVVHVGAARTLSAVRDIGRLRSEIIAMARGEKVDNPLLSSLETAGGAEFGTDSYKLVFPFDAPDLQYQLFGKDTVTSADRLLRGGLHLQGKLSLWRAIHGAQQRGMAEQIVRKAARYVNEGKDDAALADMGFTPEVRAQLQIELADPAVATFGPNGELQRLDVTRFSSQDTAEAFIQAVHRGSAQIIQGTFVGETGKWAHSGLLRLLTQFRTFSITSVEKQWTRQKASRGPAAALGILLGAMSMAAPIYMARTYVNSMGREDQEEYLEKQLAPAQVARATLNYVALSGLSGDFLDALTAVTGVGTATGGRSAAGSQFVGNVIAPAAGLADDLWRGVQNTKEGTDPSDLLKSLPFAKLPFMIPAINSLGD